MQFEGIYPPIITPHHDDGTIDKDGFVQMVEYLIDAQVHGIIVGGTTGEYYAQSNQEREMLIRLASETIKDRLPLIVGVGAMTTSECIEYGNLALQANASAILMNAPPYSLPDQAELAHHAITIDRAINLPIMLYNYPGRTGTIMEKAFFDEVSQHPNFCGIKESTGDINQLHLLARNYDGITLLCGMDDQALEFFAWGARGWVCAGGNCLPKEHIAMYQACAIENDFVKGRKIMSALMPFMTILEQSGKFLQNIKHACRVRGLPAGPVRAPLLEADQQQRDHLESVLQTMKTEMDQILT